MFHQLHSLLCNVSQVELWKKYIQWEKSNPMRTEDHAVITRRGNYGVGVILLIRFSCRFLSTKKMIMAWVDSVVSASDRIQMEAYVLSLCGLKPTPY